MYDDTSLQFTHENPLFAFDKMSCERTTEFKLPATPTNDRAFSLARIPAYRGEGMRRRFDAQLYAGTVVKDGYLYVSAFNGEDYSAIFVTGDLIQLQRAKNVGSIRTIINSEDSFDWRGSAIPANQASLPNVAMVQYDRASGINVNPSVSVRWLLEQAARDVQISIHFPLAESEDRLRIFSNSNEYKIEDIGARLINDPYAWQDPINLSPILGITTYRRSSACTFDATAYMDAGGLDWNGDAATLINEEMFEELVFPYDTVVEFPSNTPVNYCIATGDIMCRYVGSALRFRQTIDFIGSRKFSVDVNGVRYFGDPLAGQRITIPADTPFVVINGDGVKYPKPTAVGQHGTIGFDANLVPAYDLSIKVSSDYKFVFGDTVPVSAIIPDLTFVELCKIYAAVRGCVLNYTEEEGLNFDAINLSSFGTKEASNLDSIGNVSRRFCDYARANVIQFASGANVLQGEILQAIYFVDNDNIEERKILETLKVSEGGMRVRESTGVFFNCVYVRENEDVQAIADAKTDYTYMQRVELPKNAGIQALCDASTQVELQARMSLMEYEAIKPNTKIWLRGTEYVWTSRSWQKDVAKFVLAKI